ncbi:hypothetical protein KVE23_04160 [Helicobacter pylori]|nr:hypothetical protein [Helicobacter pylori]WQS65281.1 hypothetical protein KVE23_04160 [Helicobacter pylori]
MGHYLIITETAIAFQTLMGIIPPQTSLKHKSHNEPSKKECTIVKSMLEIIKSLK